VRRRTTMDHRPGFTGQITRAGARHPRRTLGLRAVLLIMTVAIVGVVAGLSSGCGSGDDAPRFDVSVQFTTEATQDDIDEVGDFLRTFDDDLEYLILEVSPPIGQAVVTTEAADFCQTVGTELGGKSYVDDVSCGPLGGE
jgi:hypothetical protein